MIKLKRLINGQVRSYLGRIKRIAHSSSRADQRAAESILPSNRPDPVFVPFLSGESARILFVAQHPAIWSTWRSVWQAMSTDARFAPKVVLAPFVHTYSSSLNTLKQLREALLQEGVPFCPSESLDLDAFRPHVVFIPNPYDETRAEAFRTESLIRKGYRIAYVPYGLEVGGGAWNIRAQFDLPTQKRAWRIFARSEQHRRLFGTHCSSGNSHVVVTGHPKLDSLRNQDFEPLTGDIQKKINQRKVVLWTPHFSVGSPPAWSTFQLFSKRILEEFSHHLDLFLLIRPHPLFFKIMNERGIWGPQGESEFRQFISSSPNMAIDDTADHRAAFSASSALMADAGSFLLEYLPLNKPLLYLEHPEGLGLSDDGELYRILYHARSGDEISIFLKMLQRSEDPIQPERSRVTPTLLAGLDQNIGLEISKRLHTDLSSSNDWIPDPKNGVITQQSRSESYWLSASQTELASPDYYIRKHERLHEVMRRHSPRVSKAIDLGCGTGKFSIEVAKYSDHVAAFDISPVLIKIANETASAEGAKNVTFSAQELEEIAPLEKYDLVSCLEVTSCVISDHKFLRLLSKIRSLSRKDGLLLLIDSLSSGQEQFHQQADGYQAKYRNLDDYKKIIQSDGWALIEEVPITQILDRKLVNHLFLFRNAR